MIVNKLILLFIVPLVALSQPLLVAQLEGNLAKVKAQRDQKLDNTLALESKLALKLDELQSLLEVQRKVQVDMLTLDERKDKSFRFIRKEIDEELTLTKIPLKKQINISRYRYQNKYRAFLKCLKRNLGPGVNYNLEINSCDPKRAQGFAASNSFMKKLSDAREVFAKNAKQEKQSVRLKISNIRAACS